MGTIAEKLNYLKDTKTAIKNALIEQDVEVNDNDTFRSYADKVKGISRGITPTGTLDITENGNYDVTNYANANVNVAGGVTSKLPSVIDGSVEVLNEEDFGDITEIRDNAFLRCTKLREVHIPETVKRVGNEAFWTTNDLNGAEVYYNGTFERVSSTFGSFLTSEDNYINYYKLNDNLYAIFDKVNFSDEETEITINENCEYISCLALSPSTTSINIPSRVKSIDYMNGNGLTSLVIPDSVQYIWLIQASSLTTLTLGSGLKYMDNYCFSGSPNITSITYNGTIEQWNNIELPDSWGFTQEIDVVCLDGTVKINESNQITIKLINTGTQTVDFTPAVVGSFNMWSSSTTMTQDGNTYTATVTGALPIEFIINNNGNWDKFINDGNNNFIITTDCTVTANFDEFSEGEGVITGTLTEGV